MRSMFRLALAAALSFGLFGCGGATAKSSNTTKPTTYVGYQTRLDAFNKASGAMLTTTEFGGRSYYVAKCDERIRFALPGVGRSGPTPGIIRVRVVDLSTGFEPNHSNFAVLNDSNVGNPIDVAAFYKAADYLVYLEVSLYSGGTLSLGGCYLRVETAPATPSNPKYQIWASTRSDGAWTDLKPGDGAFVGRPIDIYVGLASAARGGLDIQNITVTLPDGTTQTDVWTKDGYTPLYWGKYRFTVKIAGESNSPWIDVVVADEM